MYVNMWVSRCKAVIYLCCSVTSALMHFTSTAHKWAIIAQRHSSHRIPKLIILFSFFLCVYVHCAINSSYMRWLEINCYGNKLLLNLLAHKHSLNASFNNARSVSHYVLLLLLLIFIIKICFICAFTKYGLWERHDER